MSEQLLVVVTVEADYNGTLKVRGHGFGQSPFFVDRRDTVIMDRLNNPEAPKVSHKRTKKVKA